MKIFRISLYKQVKHVHPQATVIPKGYERVEVVTAGRGWLKHQENWVELRSGDLLWHYPGDETIGKSDFENPYQCLNIIFETDRHFKKRVNRISHWANLQQIMDFSREILNGWLDDRYPKDILFDYAYNLLRFKAMEGEFKKEEEQKPMQVKQALAFIEKNYSERIDISQMAKIAQCSVPYLHELFQKHCDQSPYAMLISIRIREACRRLSTSNDPIKQIALETGFTHSSAFSHSFKTTMGQSPATYRRKMLYPFID